MARSSRSLSFALFAATCGVSAIACGSLDGDPSAKVPLATVRGELVNSASVQTAQNVRVAVLWRAEKFGRFNVAVDLPVQPIFPSKFQIQLTSAPPADQLYNPFANDSVSGGGPTSVPPSPGLSPSPGPGPVPTPAPDEPPAGGAPKGGSPVPMPTGPAATDNTYPADFRAALGTIVAYEDTNGNGKLDLIGDDAAGFVDRILGANQNLALVYLQGTLAPQLADGAGVMPTQGYNLYRIGQQCARDIDVLQVGSDGVPLPPPPSTGVPCTPTANAWLPIGTLYELPLAADPSLGRLMCKSGNSPSSGSSSAGRPNPEGTRPIAYPAAGTSGLRCNPDGAGYVLESCIVIDGGPCRGTETTCSAEIWRRPTPIPADWPCTAK